MKFEGEEVDGYKITLRQYKGDLELPLANDEVVELRIWAKVSEVSHAVNQRSGEFHRVHIVHVHDVEVVR